MHFPENTQPFESPPNAPIFYPNEDEFSNALDYISKIRPIAERVGICKIVPPKSWKPNFSINMHKFKFIPRLQKLNELEAGTRIKLNFLDNLSKFWDLQGTKLKIPNMEKKSLDLYRLHKIVNEEGGYEEVWKNKKWGFIAKSLNLKDSGSPRMLKHHYEKLLYPYVIFKSGITIPCESQESKTNLKTFTSHQLNMNLKNTNIRKRKLDLLNIESISCFVCNRGDDEAFILLCDGCDASYHTYCLYPPLSEIPKGDWRCPKCVSEICKDSCEFYGFEQSQREYTLAEFGEMADKFKKDYFNSPSHSVPYEVVEKEFWRILSSPNEIVTVKYGADLHTLDVGSGFHYSKVDSNSKYINSEWNLNNLPQLKKSVLSFLNADISGMKIPWAYVGMCFSCFCWHVEDHWSYSVNYLHFGEPKTWYGVSGAFAEKFEDVMKKNAPELFDKSPDLLHHLVTIMNPNILLKQGVPITKINQNAGEFVITFPRAYHAGFNQGFNFAEAVNFCPSDWLRIGRAAIEHYKQLKRYPVFSHDELVCKMASEDELDVETCGIIYLELINIIDYEKNYRKILQDMGINSAKKINFELLPDDERQCYYCKTTCFVSAVCCSCIPTNLVCICHVQYLCKCNVSNYMLKYRYTLDELSSLISKSKKKNESFKKWQNNVERILSNNDKIEYHEFKSLIEVANKNGYSKNNYLYIDLYNIYQDVVECETMCKKVINFLQYDKPDCLKDYPATNISFDISLKQLKEFMNRLEKLPCCLPDFKHLKKFYSEILEVENNAEECKKNKLLDINLLTKYVDYFSKMRIDFGQLHIDLKLLYKQAKWISEVDSIINNQNKFNLSTIHSFLIDATRLPALSNSIIEKKIHNLQELYCIAKIWDFKAETCISNLTTEKLEYNLEILEKICNEGKFIPVRMPNMDKLIQLVSEARNLDNQIYDVLNEKQISITCLENLRKKVKKHQFIKSKYSMELEKLFNKFDEWKSLLKETFIKPKSNLSLLEAIMPYVYEIKKFTDINNITKETEANLLLENNFKNIEKEKIDKILRTRKNNYQKFLNALMNDFLNLKCCLCSKFLTKDDIIYCNLCANFMHGECSRKINDNSTNEFLQFCNKCQKSKRPSFSKIKTLLSNIEDIRINCEESFVLKILIKRIYDWQNNLTDFLKLPEMSIFMSKLENGSYNVSQLQLKLNDEYSVHFSKLIYEIIKSYECLKENLKLQLEELYINGILMEVDLSSLENNGVFMYVMTLIEKNKYKHLLNDDEKEIITNNKDLKFKTNKKTKNIANSKFLFSLNESKVTKYLQDDVKTSKMKILKNEDICAASLCVVPLGDNIEWVQCDGFCNRWFHLMCVGLEKIEPHDEYICTDCKNSKLNDINVL